MRLWYHEPMTKYTQSSVVIIGFGRFGQLLADLIKDSFKVSIVEPDAGKQQLATDHGLKVVQLPEIASADFIFLAVPISAFEATVQQIAPLVGAEQVVIDICSVKVHPANLMRQHLSHCQTIATHPLFGPDSASKGLASLKMVLCRLEVSDPNYGLWKDFWTQKGLTVIEATPEEHDRDAVYSQAFTYSLARIIQEMRIPELRFTTRSYGMLDEVARLSANDSDELFHDMLYYNPYFVTMKSQLETAVSNVSRRLDAIAAERDAADTATRPN